MNEQTIVERIRILNPKAPMLEMHRNTQVDPHPSVLVNEMLGEIRKQSFHRYPDIEPFHTKLAKFLKVDKSRLLLTSGVDGALRTVFECLTSPGHTVVFLEPTYMMYHIYAQAYGVKTRTLIPGPNFSFHVQTVMGALIPKVSALLLANPHEPVENVFSFDEIARLVHYANDVGTTVLIDEAYYGFGSATVLPLLKTYKNLLIARSFSKAFGLPSIRLGCLIGSPSVIRRLNSRRLAYETNSLSLAAATWALDHADRIRQHTEKIMATRTWLISTLERQGLETHGKCSNSILVKVPCAEIVAQKLAAKRILVRLAPPPAEGWISVTVGLRESMEKFVKTLKNAL